MDSVDVCKDCKVFDLMDGRDPYESEWFFSCSDCPCYSCPDKHFCSGQCMGGN